MSQNKLIYFPKQHWLPNTSTVRTLALCLTSDQWFWNLYCTKNNVIAKYIISVVSDNILRRHIKEPLLILKQFIVLLHTLSAYNILLVRFKVYSSDTRKGLCTNWRYGEAYENLSIDPAPCRKNPIKNKIVIRNCQRLLLEEN